MTKARVVSGMRPTGKLHLGHLVGALRNWAPLQEQYDCFYFVADWHALTSEYANPKSITSNAIKTFVDGFSAGGAPAGTGRPLLLRRRLARADQRVRQHEVDHVECHRQRC